MNNVKYLSYQGYSAFRNINNENRKADCEKCAYTHHMKSVKIASAGLWTSENK